MGPPVVSDYDRNIYDFGLTTAVAVAADVRHEAHEVAATIGDVAHIYTHVMAEIYTCTAATWSIGLRVHFGFYNFVNNWKDCRCKAKAGLNPPC